MLDRRLQRMDVPQDRRNSNRRAFPRWEAEFDVQYGHGKNLHPGKGRDIGECGLSFVGDAPVMVYSEIDLQYRLRAEDPWVHVRALVKHIRDGVIGVEFMTLRIPDRLRILDFISTLPDGN